MPVSTLHIDWQFGPLFDHLVGIHWKNLQSLQWSLQVSNRTFQCSIDLGTVSTWQAWRTWRIWRQCSTTNFPDQQPSNLLGWVYLHFFCSFLGAVRSNLLFVRCFGCNREVVFLLGLRWLHLLQTLHFTENLVYLKGQVFETIFAQVIQILLNLHGLHQIVFDKARCCLGVMCPAAQWANELRCLYSSRSIQINHFKEHLQVIFINVHHTQSTLKVRISPRSFNQLFQSHLPVFNCQLVYFVASSRLDNIGSFDPKSKWMLKYAKVMFCGMWPGMATCYSVAACNGYSSYNHVNPKNSANNVHNTNAEA